MNINYIPYIKQCIYQYAHNKRNDLLSSPYKKFKLFRRLYQNNKHMYVCIIDGEILDFRWGRVDANAHSFLILFSEVL